MKNVVKYKFFLKGKDFQDLLGCGRSKAFREYRKCKEKFKTDDVSIRHVQKFYSLNEADIRILLTKNV